MKFVRIIFAASDALFMAMSSCQESPVVDDPDNNGGTPGQDTTQQEPVNPSFMFLADTELGTFECEAQGAVIGARTFYGFNITGWPSQWELKHFACDGTITVTELGNGVWRYEADLVSWFGETMFVEFEGVPDPLVYYVM